MFAVPAAPTLGSAPCSVAVVVVVGCDTAAASGEVVVVVDGASSIAGMASVSVVGVIWGTVVGVVVDVSESEPVLPAVVVEDSSTQGPRWSPS